MCTRQHEHALFDKISEACYIDGMSKTVSSIERELHKSRLMRAKDDTRELRRLSYLVQKLLKTRRNHSSGGSAFSRGFRSTQTFGACQLCVVKMRYGTDKAAHVKFLREYLPQENKREVTEKPRVFSADEQAVRGYEKDMDAVFFKYIVSPDNQDVDIPALVKTLMKQVSAVTGYELSWVAAEHTNTAHKHAHILINGVDTKGRAVRFSKTFIKETLRNMACTVCTQLVGERTQEEIRQSAVRSLSANRLTDLDERIAQQAADTKDERCDGEIVIAESMPDVRLRLSHLEALGLAVRRDKKYRLEKRWRETLAAQGRYNTFLKARAELRFTEKEDLRLYSGKNGAADGIVTKLIRMDDEDNWNNAVVIENRALHCAWYIPVRYEADKELLGKQVCVQTQQTARGVLRPTIRVVKPEQER